jgi:hypothetical protein
MPINLLFLLSPLLVLIPGYPYAVSFIYLPIGLIQMFNLGRENNEIYYSALLPVRKNSFVKSRFLLVIGLQVADLLLTIPCLYLNGALKIINYAGLEANWALEGLGLIMFGLFNVIFLTMFYKTGVKSGIPFLLAFSIMLIVGESLDLVFSFVKPFPSLLDTTIFQINWAQGAVFASGLLIYILLTLASYLLSIQEAEKIEI